jgi:hypothetical protein
MKTPDGLSDELLFAAYLALPAELVSTTAPLHAMMLILLTTYDLLPTASSIGSYSCR